MSDDSFNCDEETLQKLKKIKSEMGFDKKNWNEWFNDVFNLEDESEKDTIERIIRKNGKAFWYEDWIRNFSLNLENIWNGRSVKELYSKYSATNHSGLVIGRGPSIKKFNHLKMLSNSNFKGPIICSDAGLPTILESGVTPDKFDIYVLTIDAQEIQKFGYQNTISKKYGEKIKCILSSTSHPEVYVAAKDAGMEIFWVHTLIDHGHDKTSFNHIQGIMTKAKDSTKSLPAIQTGANVGTAAWIISWSVLKCKEVGLIGIDHGYNADTPWEQLNIDGHPFPKNIDQNSEAFKKAYPTIYNPGFDCHCKQDPLFAYYSNALIDFINKAKDKVKTINATEGGSIFSDNVECMKFENFLLNHNF